MSIARCNRCERQVDTDFEEMSDDAYKLSAEEVCVNCEEEYIAEWREDNGQFGMGA